MRLLRRTSDDQFYFTEDLDETAVPPYAILSHTWGDAKDEVTFEDIQSGGGRTKLGFKKIRLCGIQAEQDGLQHFWVDTCCIDKANKAELSHAINSMYRWYTNANRCYVYLADVLDPTDEFSPPLREGLRKSRWFTRGWTLQELLAPETVEFFTCEWRRLGDKTSLQQYIHEITGISHTVLQGGPIAQLDVEERLSWNIHRQTTLEEDKIYSLLGVFDVYLSPLYGEGASKARDRVMNQIKERERCIRDLRPGDPRDDKRRIEEIKGGLLESAYCWVLDNPSFRQWYNDSASKLLWIRGDPGKGKTMLVCGIINELQKTVGKRAIVSYFFCQATDSRINTATAILRGLLYMIVIQQPLLASYIRKKYDQVGKSLFEDVNAWAALTDIFANILRDPSLSTIYLLVDALDECVTDLPKLFNFLAENVTVSSRVKWIVTSRNWPDIKERLEEAAAHNIQLSLELNTASVSTAVSIFIQRKVFDLAQRKKYDEPTQNAVLQHLLLNANDTFLWVALVCKSLESTSKRNIPKKLSAFPTGLDSLYERMMEQISRLDDDAELCKQVLACVTLIYRPVTLQELATIVKQIEDQAKDSESLQEIVQLCGSFLTLRQDTVYFVHQSAQDFLLDKAAEIFPSGKECIHHSLFIQSLQALSATLHRDMYKLKEPGYSIDDLEQPRPDILAPVRYSCIYWVDHLQGAHAESLSKYAEDFQDDGVVDTFLRKNYLYWLESLSLCKSLSRGIISLARLELLVKKQDQAAQLTELVYDMLRFAMYHKVAIECSPLQTYISALVFSPTNSFTRRLFQHEAPKDIVIKPHMQESWGACLQTLEGHSNSVTSLTFSSNSMRLASGSHDNTIKVWDMSSGECLQTLKGHSDLITSVVFLSNSLQLASGSRDKTIKIWDISSGECRQTLEGHSNSVTSVTSVTFSSDSTRLASGSYDKTIKIWDISSKDCTSSGECLQTLEGHSNSVTSVIFSSDLTRLAPTRLASGSQDKTAKIWDISSGECLQTLEGYNDSVTSVAFSSDSTRLASGSWDRTIKIWNASSGECLQTLEGRNPFNSVTFLSDSTQLASGSWYNTIQIWDISSGKCMQALEGHSDSVTSVTFSSSLIQLASASSDNTVKVWDISRKCPQTLETHSNSVISVTFSSDLARLVSGSHDRTVKIWETSSGECIQTLKGHNNSVTSVTVSSDLTRLASGSWNKIIKIWDINSGECLQTLQGHKDFVTSVAFSSDPTRLASGSYGAVKIWDTSSGECLQTLAIKGTAKQISFDSTGCFLNTDVGLLVLDDCPKLKVAEAVHAECLCSTGISLSTDRTWIAYDGRRELWIPSEYRSACSSIHDNSIGIGARSGRVWICNINRNRICKGKPCRRAL